MRRLLWILLAIVTIALLVLVLQQNEAALAELSRFDTSSLETKIMALALVGLIALTLFRQRFSHALESALIWIMLAMLLALGYTYRFEPLEVLNYSVNVDTANGRARAAPVTLDRLSIGGIIERSVPALIAQPGQLRTSLLGMTFLNRLESWEVRGDKLLMRGYP